MKRETGIFAAAFAMLALVAGSGVAQMPVVGTIQDADNAIQLTVEQCQTAWEASPAYNQCGDRSSAEGAGQAENVEPVGNLCAIATSCEYYASQGTNTGGATKVTLKRQDTNWNGGLATTALVKNCNGTLWLNC